MFFGARYAVSNTVLVEPIMLAVAVVDKYPERHRLVVVREVRHDPRHIIVKDSKVLSR
jgi:hypothetical protein